VILDGTLIPTDRVAADEPYYSQKHKKHGMNVQVVAAPDGTPLWFSRALPGRAHDLTAARAHGVIENCHTRQILVLADRAYQGAGATVRTPYYHHHELPELLPPPRTARALPAVQPGPRPTTRPWRTRLRTAENLAPPWSSPMLDQPHRTHRRRRPHPPDLRIRRMKGVQWTL
jgi:hypothetical protein